MHSSLYAPPPAFLVGRPGLQELRASVRLAATSVAERSDDALRIVNTALRGGLAAATLGVPLPLFVLVDVASVLSLRQPGRLLPERGRASRAATLPYDQWLRRFIEAVPPPVSAVTDDRERRTRTLPRERGFLPMLTDAWAARKRQAAGTCVGWAGAYRELLQDGDMAFSIVEDWTGERVTDPDVWQAWFPRHSTDAAEWPRPSPMSGLWSCWAAAAAEQPQEPWLHEEFDHEAAACWLAAGPAGTPRRLWPAVERLRRRSLEDDRVRRESVEEPHPIDGRIRMALLTRGRYGKFQIVNGAWKFADYPRSDVALDLHVHLALCRPGRRAASRRVRFPSDVFAEEDAWFLPADESEAPADPAAAGDATITAASLLHAAGAMILDDLRVALVGLTVQIHPHAATSSERDEYVGRLDVSPGPAWRSQLLVGGRPRLPPAEVVRALFRRRTCVDDWSELGLPISEAKRRRARRNVPLVWPALHREFPGAAEWFVGVALQDDLEDAGWSPATEAGSAAWILPARVRLPETLHHLVLLEADHFSGRIFEVERAGGERRVRLRPWRRHSIDPGRGHDTLRPLRGAVLELAFEALSFPAQYKR